MKAQDTWTRELARRRRLKSLGSDLQAAKRWKAKSRRKRLADHEGAVVKTWKRRRASVVSRLYRRLYKRPPTTVHVRGPLGLEMPEDTDAFLDIASALVDFEARQLTIDLTECTRVWPTGVTLLCSLAKWTELAARDRPPQIVSTLSNDPAVESYLQHCGFYDFVGVHPTHVDGRHSPAYVVRIRRESSPSAIEERESEVLALLDRHSELSDEQIELFNSIVLTEVFNNVTEHGVARHEQGWWILSQYHPTHRVISLCIADNGIGIRHTLSTGPQGDTIRAKMGPAARDDDYIRLALEENVSGALDAGTRSKPLFGPERYDRGSSRGYGLRRIRDTCKTLKVPFSLLSQHGFVGIDAEGVIDRRESRRGRIFAGTLYHFVLPAGEVRQ